MAEEQGHADAFVSRIMFLGADSVLKPARTPTRAGTLSELFRADLRDGQEAIVFDSSAAREADDVADIGSRTLFEQIVLGDEGHLAGLQVLVALLKPFGGAAETGTQVIK